MLGEVVLPFILRIIDALVPGLLPASLMAYLVVGFHGLIAASWAGGCIALFVYLCRKMCVDQACKVAGAGLAFSAVNG